MSNEYHDVTEKMKERLKSASSSMCLAKWNMVSMHLTNGKTHSCYHPPTHDIPLEGLSENPGLLHNTPQKIEERAMMRKGERPKGCSYCWRIEDAGHTSDRHYRSSEWWNSPDFEKITLGDAELDASWTPAYVEVNFNQACNFKCLYCSPHLSSAWEEEIVKHGPISLTDARHNDLDALGRMNLMPKKVANRDNPYVEAFWKWWPDLYKNLKIFRMTGGEPLIDNNTWKVLDYVDEHPNSLLEVSITSNLCPPKPDIFDKFISKVQKLEEVRVWENPERLNPDSGNHWYVAPAIKHFSLFASCDSVGKQAEYIRTGMDYDVLKTNVSKFLHSTQGTSVTFINTFNVLSVPGLRGFLEWILELREEFAFDKQERKVIQPPDHNGFKHPPFIRNVAQRIWFDIPMLHSPSWLNMKILHEETEIIEQFEDCLQFMRDNVQQEDYNRSLRGFKPYEIDKVQRDLDILKAGMDPHQKQVDMKRFAEYVDEMDRRRNTNFKETFPELINFYNKCKDL